MGTEAQLSLAQAADMCVDADIAGETHYPTDAYSVLASHASDRDLSTDDMIREARFKRTKAELGPIVVGSDIAAPSVEG